RAPSAVVLNHADRLPANGRDEVLYDLRRLLADQGIASVPVLTTSAVTGAGVDSLRAVLGAAVQKRSVAAEAVRAELVSAGTTLAKALNKGADPRLPDAPALAAEIAHAAGVDALAEAAAAIAG